ncbi:FecR domain-containing protein [Paenibacillus rhizovicinus]|uniref:FecR domain-containing protein n=1 Tax=Paenibacillus rhizovicinus TaxID=2704463 RepID=A0A6C0P6N2_9BACL|nr:FecR family protein [Paenibacillus rhizovicinus]QHW34240.1 FecR domain-containing protein [Paenibacillus rhizovicinus]
MRNSSFRTVIAVICFLLVIGPASLFAGKHASAQIMRVAIVQSLKGSVTVMKSGGAKPFKAFKNMSLNEGDQITTGKDGGAVLELASANADKDTVTIAANSVVDFSKLKDSGGTKTKISIWAGSLWVKVKSVSNASDQFEVETPTSIMGVRGTQFYVGVDPVTGLTQLFLAAGVVESRTNDNRLDESTDAAIDRTQVIYSAQQLAEYMDADGIHTQSSIIDLSSFVSNASPDIIRVILSSAQSINEENSRMMEQAKESLGTGTGNGGFGGQTLSQAELERLQQNLNNLVSLIAQEALSQHKIDTSVIDKINEAAGGKLIDLSIAKQLDLTAEERKKQELLEKLLKEKEEQAAREKAAKDALLQKTNAALLAKQKAEELRKQNEQREKELQNAAELAYAQGLSDAELQAFNQNRINNGLPPITPGKSSSNSTGGSTGTTAPQSTAKASLKFSDSALETSPLQAGGPLELNVVFSGFAAAQPILGYQIEVEYDSRLASFDEYRFSYPETALQYRAGAPGFKVKPERTYVTEENSVDDYRIINGTTTSRLIYSVAKFSGDASIVSDGTVMVKLPFLVYPSSGTQAPRAEDLISVPFHIRSIAAIGANGDSIGIAAGPDLTVRVQPMTT